jgi:hypothetical protein
MSSNTQKKPRAASYVHNKGAQKADVSKGKRPSAGGKTPSASKQRGIIGALFAPVLFHPSENSIAQNGNSITSGVDVNKGLFSFVMEVYGPANLS